MPDLHPNEPACEHTWSRLNGRRWCTSCAADGGPWPPSRKRFCGPWRGVTGWFIWDRGTDKPIGPFRTRAIARAEKAQAVR